MITINKHSSIKIDNLYFDPFEIEKEMHDAKIVFVTHDHYDHFSPEDIEKVMNNETILVCPSSCEKAVRKAGLSLKNIVLMDPNDFMEIEGVKVTAIHSYNVGKLFHPKRNKWLGYLVELDGTTYYVPGDMDENEDALNVKCDVAFLPIGGTYTMNAKEAAKFANKIRPKVAIPIHYGSVVGKGVKGTDFSQYVDKEIEVKIFI